MDKAQILLLRTKLHRPPLPVGHVPRFVLLDWLTAEPRHPMVLVSAPAGYGKSTLVSSWLEKHQTPSAWLSLDDGDNDLYIFLNYFVAAVQTIFPEAAKKTLDLINSTTLPPISILAKTLLNDLDEIDEAFIIVIDDIHRIKERVVHDFFSLILQQPGRFLQLVLIGRRDPPISIASMRAKGLLLEIRMRDLCFTEDEALAFLQTGMMHTIETSTALALAKKTEGWVTGLRLAVLAMRGIDEPGLKLLELKGTTRYVVDYLISEVLDRQSVEIRDFLLSTAVLNRFCAPLCDAMLEKEETSGKTKINGENFINWLQDNNLFTIALDIENKWFRYHHLFQHLLQRLLEQKTAPEKVLALHRRASRWFASQNLIDEALAHAITAGELEYAADIVEAHRVSILNADKWPVLAGWLSRLPDEIVWKRPELLLGEAWLAYYRFRIPALIRIVDQLTLLLSEGCSRPAWEGELSMFKSYLYYWQGQVKEMLTHVENAQDKLPATHDLMRADSVIYFGLAHHMAGQKDVAVDVLTNRIREQRDQKSLLMTRQVITLAFIHLLAGNLKESAIYSRQLFELGQTISPVYIKSWSTYLSGCCYFQSGNWLEAEQCFRWIAENRYIAHTAAVMSSLIGLGLTHNFMGRHKDAVEIAQQLIDYAVETNDPDNLAIAKSGSTRINLLRHDVNGEISLSEDTGMATAFIFLEVPHVTHCRLLIAQDSRKCTAQALAALEHLQNAFEDIYNTFHLIDIFSLKAVAYQRLGRHNDAVDALEHALELAFPNDWARPFVESGPPMMDLLACFPQKGRKGQIDHILKAFATETVSVLPTSAPFLVEPLTIREMDILELLVQRLQNKEIAEKLFISPITVKSHLRNIYQKLQVEKRLDAVEKAVRLKLLTRY